MRNSLAGVHPGRFCASLPHCWTASGASRRNAHLALLVVRLWWSGVVVTVAAWKWSDWRAGKHVPSGPRASRAVRRRTHSDIAADVPPRRRSLVSPSRASRRSTWQCAGSVPSQDLSSGDEDRPSRVTLHFAQLFLHPIHYDAFLCRLVFNFCFAIRYPGTMEDNSFSILWHVVPDSSAFSNQRASQFFRRKTRPVSWKRTSNSLSDRCFVNSGCRLLHSRSSLSWSKSSLSWSKSRS